jgi:hypothetical protein
VSPPSRPLSSGISLVARISADKPSSRTKRIEDILKSDSAMLKKIYSWWLQNLNDPAGPQAQKYDLSLGLQGASNLLSFEVHIISNDTSQILCPQASLHDDWKETESVQLFVCRCSQTGTARRHATCSHPRVENIACKRLNSLAKSE